LHTSCYLLYYLLYSAVIITENRLRFVIGSHIIATTSCTRLLNYTMCASLTVTAAWYGRAHIVSFSRHKRVRHF